MKQLLVHLSKENQKQLVDEFYQKVGDKADIEWSCDWLIDDDDDDDVWFGLILELNLL